MQASNRRNWTVIVRDWVRKSITLEDLLPDHLPIYARSYAYSMGGLALTSLLLIIISGVIMVLNGPTWWQVSATGALIRAIHFWGVQVYFFVMTLHAAIVLMTSAWRGGRAWTWVAGSLMYVLSIVEAFTGYLMRGDFFSQWNQVQGKDAINSAGGAAFVNLLNNGQLYGIHIVVLPLVLLLALLPLHLFLIRKKRLVPPPEEE